MVKLNKIYTKTGDAGESGLADGSRRPKQDLLFHAIGDVDEANSLIGLARLHTESLPHDLRYKHYDEMLLRIQHDLFDLGADLATPDIPSPAERGRVREGGLRIIASQVTRLEEEIDQLNTHLDPLNSFVLPGGSELAARLHVARAVVRRAERVACELAQKETINAEAIKYLNRLSDFLFVLARAANENGRHDVLWKPGVNR